MEDVFSFVREENKGLMQSQSIASTKRNELTLLDARP